MKKDGEMWQITGTAGFVPTNAEVSVAGIVFCLIFYGITLHYISKNYRAWYGGFVIFVKGVIIILTEIWYWLMRYVTK